MHLVLVGYMLVKVKSKEQISTFWKKMIFGHCWIKTVERFELGQLKKLIGLLIEIH